MLGYIASPYSHPDHNVTKQRVNKVAQLTAKLISLGLHAISPIVHNVGLIEKSSDALPPGWNNWKKQDEALLSCCDFMIIYCIDGWEESIGIKEEINICTRKNIPYYRATDDTNFEELLDKIIGDLKLKNNTECFHL